ncbi:secretin and TonB N-terminal domain-containing protein [Janthinobacterium agaricidamnosum]|uniref:Bacterial type II and III secretion system family protein n=1 Tax=Janthinobacterium agaricidamnosum NBRC 102515 = DSM 9628 TaxID=1349767 RepID=W0V210_9BURK|nr:secretin and TonB N-terminal domain-containing protein [Janthinobacterium agaricidamnosum]CDG81312.1 bacterial type II and III secretion system family protein [Janthinobacterium agaricidamnosum NBRC 102515 = DSM 9628]
MNRTASNRLAIVALSVLLSACAASQAFKEGNALLDEGKNEQGLAKLEQALRAEPDNAQFRIALTNRKMRLVNGFNSRADSMRQQANNSEAEQFYRQSLAIDPNNAVAQQGLAALAQDRRHQRIVAEAGAVYQRGGAANLAQAQETLRQVLLERPSQRDALALKSRIGEAQAKSNPPNGRLAAAYRKPVTLEFRDAPLRSVFDFIGKVSGLNFVFDKEVDPNLRATISVRDTSIEDAIGLLLGANQLEQSVSNEKSITIYPNTPQKVKDYQQLVVRTFFLANADVKTVAFSIKTLLRVKDIVTDERLGIIMMRDTPEMIRMAERIINVQDLADPEVMLEVEVLEVKRTRLMELGIRWPEQATLTLAGTPDSFGLSNLKVDDLRHIRGDNIKLGIGNVVLNANKTDTDSNILANPRIRVRNKEKAKILIGDRVPVITVTTNNGVSSDSVNYIDVGLKLDVEPNIYLDDEVAIKVNLEVSNVVKDLVSKSGTQAYQIGTRSASTVLRLRDGETQVLAGLISDEDRSSANKVPGIGELPVLSRLFGSQKDDTSRNEIVLSITPRLLRSIRRPDLATAEFNSGTESNAGGRGTIGGAEPAQDGGSAPPRLESPMTGGADLAPSPPPPAPADAARKGGQ